MRNKPMRVGILVTLGLVTGAVVSANSFLSWPAAAQEQRSQAATASPSEQTVGALERLDVHCAPRFTGVPPAPRFAPPGPWSRNTAVDMGRAPGELSHCRARTVSRARDR